MTTAFDPTEGLVVVSACVWGPSGDRVLRLALDTGATSTILSSAILVAVGYAPAPSGERVRMTTGSGVEYVPLVNVERILALGTQQMDFPVISHTLPPTASVDGLVGLDFFREQRLTIDFRAGEITLE